MSNKETAILIQSTRQEKIQQDINNIFQKNYKTINDL